MTRVLGEAMAIMPKGHGIVTVGRSIDEACILAMYLERTAKIQAVAQSFGYSGPTDAFREEMQVSRDKMMAMPDGPRPTHSAEWAYYADEVRKGERWTRGMS